MKRDRAAELRWVFRPAPHRAPEILNLAGLAIHSAAAAGVDGGSDVVLSDGSRLRAARAEIVAE